MDSNCSRRIKGNGYPGWSGDRFPFGQQTSAVKAFETEEAVRMGATVLDNCMNVGALKDKRYDEIKQEFKEYVEAAQGVDEDDY